MTCGGVVQLYATGKQDVSISGNPEATFFVSRFKRHVQFSQTLQEQAIVGTPTRNGVSTVKLERKGDLISYVYLTFSNYLFEWFTYITSVELLVGGQVIDKHDARYTNFIAPVITSNSYAKSRHSGIFFPDSTTGERFYPLYFSCFNNWESAIPLVALQYHDVELRITWRNPSANFPGEWGVLANYIYLDKEERKFFNTRPHNMLITQVQKMTGSGTKVQDLNFSNPVKCLASASFPISFFTLRFIVNNKLKFKINGEDINEPTFANPNYSSVPLYYHTSYGSLNPGDGDRFFLYPFCLDVSRFQPTGTLNFSRIESFQIISEDVEFTDDIYAISYNILRIENGMAGLMYQN